MLASWQTLASCWRLTAGLGNMLAAAHLPLLMVRTHEPGTDTIRSLLRGLNILIIVFFTDRFEC